MTSLNKLHVLGIFGKTKIQRRVYYLISWRSKQKAQSTWVSYGKLAGIKQMRIQFNNNLKSKILPYIDKDYPQNVLNYKIDKSEQKYSQPKKNEQIIGKTKLGIYCFYLTHRNHTPIESSVWHSSKSLKNIEGRRSKFNKSVKQSNIQLPYIDLKYIKKCPNYKQIMTKQISQLMTSPQLRRIQTLEIEQKKVKNQQLQISKAALRCQSIDNQKLQLNSQFQQIIGRTKINDYLHYLVKLKNKPASESIWVSRKQFCYKTELIKDFNQLYKDFTVWPFIISKYSLECIKQLEMVTEPIIAGDKTYGEIEQFIGKKKQQIYSYYLIWWKGRPIQESTWQTRIIASLYGRELVKFNRFLQDKQLPYISSKYLKKIQKVSQQQNSKRSKKQHLKESEIQFQERNQRVLLCL